MKTIRYEFNDGTISEVGVSDSFSAILTEMGEQEKNNNKTETRRHISLEYLNRFGIDVEDPDSNPLSILIKREEDKKLNEEMKIAFAKLSSQQRKLLYDVYINKISIVNIAKSEGINDGVIRQRIFRIIARLRKIFLN